jgi:hypothetical protein
MRTKLRSKISLLFMTCAVLLAIPAIVLADDIANNLDGSIDADVETTSVNTGSTKTVGYLVQPTKDVENGCNFQGTTEKLVANVTSSDTAVATVSPTQVTFDSCGSTPSVTVTGVSAGTADITLTQASNNTGGEFNFATATFKVTVTNPTPPADTTAPTIDYTLTPGTADGTNGWYKSNVTLVWNVSDPESAVTKTGCADQNITSDQAATTYSCSATSAGGSAGPVSVSIKRDATAPTINHSLSPAANGAGWNNTDVLVDYSCSDATSGVASCGPDETLSEGANQSSTGNATDNAGNTASDTVSNINIDKTDPLVSLVGGPANGSSHYFGSVPGAPTCTASDALSGLNGACSVSGYGTTVGNHTVTASATDNADNTNSASNSYTVLAWTLNGFYAPVDKGIHNIMKAGQTVPLKFEIFSGSTELTDTSVIQTFQQKIACAPGAGDDIEQFATGSTSLRYDTTSGQFIFNWKAPSQKNTCYKVTMTTLDGSSIYADFQLK